ncbi:MAG TPA: hypothetical protein VNO30_10300 [Kofleriaceae bacterium]|nr:hypothetical protein [Kofleriaceae bacterium]
MLRLPDLPLPAPAAAQLVEYQTEIDCLPTFAERVEAGKRLFGSRNNKSNATFKSVKEVLTAMCSGARRCAYCEDSAADEVEHIYPKHFYPDRVFAWPNYVYACGPCNGPKGSSFTVFTAGPSSGVELTRSEDAPSPPPTGRPGLIDPRTEDATRLLVLDLQDTFWFVERAAPGTLDHERARYTIDTLGLNKREYLPLARRAAYRDYRAHLSQYLAVRSSGGDEAELQRLETEIRTRQHPTVWSEMRRQHANIPILAPLFAAVPEALTWGYPLAM